MFHRASLKLGLEQAVMEKIREEKSFLANGSAKSSGKESMTPEEVEKLLKLGAYDVFHEGDDADAASKQFNEEVRGSVCACSATPNLTLLVSVSVSVSVSVCVCRTSTTF